MSKDDGARQALLSDSQATLRQVKGVLNDFATSPEEPESEVDRAVQEGSNAEALPELVRMLVETYSEIMEVIDNLRQSRGVLEKASVDRIQNTHSKLTEVSSATEMAATGILDGIDRALGLVDDLDQDSDPPETAGARDNLRQELHQIMDLLQFQDITSQQLGYASSVLFDVEQKLVELSELFDEGIGLADGLNLTRRSSPPSSETCDPNATNFDAEGRQALVDEIFTTPSGE